MLGDSPAPISTAPTSTRKPVSASLRRWIVPLVDASGRHPWRVLAVALSCLAACWFYASRLELRTELRELLPADSPGYQAYERQAKRLSGGAALIVLAESPDRTANEHFIDALANQVTQAQTQAQTCVEACRDETCRQACGPCLIAYVEAGSKDVRAFYEKKQWLYASLEDLEKADEQLDFEIARRSGLVEDLEDSSAEPVSAPPGTAPATPAHGLKPLLDGWKKEIQRRDEFPTGYFTSPDGTTLGLRIVTVTSGLGDRGGDIVQTQIERLVEQTRATSFHPDMKIGYAGDIPNAIEEKRSLVTEAAVATAVATLLILVGLVMYYRSLWALIVITLPALFGVGCGYAFATWKYGYINSAGAFLAAIILGNGINYPIVLLSRYQDFRAAGMEAIEARREAVLNAFRAEFVGACVAAIAYGSLVVTQFRGFSQFGAIGFVGMLMVWVSIIPLVPALVALIEKVSPQALTRTAYSAKTTNLVGEPSRVRWLTTGTKRYAFAFLSVAVLFVAISSRTVGKFLQNPWEYNFARLGSRGSQDTGAGRWSVKASVVFGGKMNVAGARLLADTPEQVPELKRQILANDRRDPQGQVIAAIATVDDLLPGSPDLQRAKLERLASLRQRITRRLLDRLPAEERKTVEEIRPPDDLAPIVGTDLPAFLRRRFEESNGTVGTVLYVKYLDNLSLSDGHNLLRIAETTGNITLPDGTKITTASRATVFAEMIRALERDGPFATILSFLGVALVIVLVTGTLTGTMAVLLSLCLGVWISLAVAAYSGWKLNFLNFIALPITFGIGSEYPFNVFDRARLLSGNISLALRRSAGAVALCSYTTTIGYSSLLFADNQALQSFGRLAASGEIACCFAALCFLPALLHTMNRSSRLRTRWTGSWFRRAPSSSKFEP